MSAATAKPATAPLLEVIVVSSTGARELVPDCLTSLERHPLQAGPMKVWLVDNGSSDGTPELVRREFDWVQLEALDWNSGFCHANNHALRQTTAPFVLVLNSDTVVHEGALDHMLELMGENPGVGVAGCRLVRRDGSLDHAAKVTFPTPLAALAHLTGIGRHPRAPDALSQYRSPRLGEHEVGEVDSVSGAFMLIRREALNEVGLLDEHYWLYMEDYDWCHRCKRAGWRVLYDGRTTVTHVKGGTTVSEIGGRRHRGLRLNLAFHRSIGRFYRKFYAGERPALDLAVYLAIATKLAISIARSTVARRSLR